MSERPDILRLDWGWIDESIDPAVVPELTAAALRRLGYPVLQYADPAGLPELRLEIAREAAGFGLRAAAANVCITNGATGAIDLLTRLLLNGKADSIALLPAFDTALEILKQNSVAVHGVAVDPFRADAALPDAVWSEIARRAASGRCRVFYSVPNHHNPTGTSLSDADRIRLFQLCRAHDVTLIEDDPYRLFSPSRPPFGPDVVDDPLFVYAGSFSKELFPGLRCGYAIASEGLIARVARLQKYTTSSANAVTQAICLEALLSGTAETIRSARRDSLRRKEAVWQQAWTELGFDSVARSAGSGGPYRWIALRDTAISSADLVRHAREQGVAVVPAAIYLLGEDAPAVRVSLLRINESDIPVAAARLLAAFKAARMDPISARDMTSTERKRHGRK
jgi:2-aminoadipate transaminase